MTIPFDKDDFLEWVKTTPDDTVFIYNNCRDCPIGQYIKYKYSGETYECFAKTSFFALGKLEGDKWTMSHDEKWICDFMDLFDNYAAKSGKFYMTGKELKEFTLKIDKTSLPIEINDED